jgi:signal transduction histidine kinase
VTADIRPEPQTLALLGHELRTPLTAVLGYAEAMRLEAFGALPEPYRRHAGLIHVAASHLLALVDAMTAPPAGGGRSLVLERMGPADAEILLKDAVHLLAPSAQSARLELRAMIGGALGFQADRVALSQIVFNLLDNAVKFTAPGGTIAISLESAGGDVRLTVESGGGEGPPAGGPGSGLGLRLAHALSEAMGGSLTVDRSPQGGARAVVRLPSLAEV